MDALETQRMCACGAIMEEYITWEQPEQIFWHCHRCGHDSTDDDMAEFEVTEIPTKKFGSTSTNGLVVTAVLSIILIIQQFIEEERDLN